MYYKGYFGDNDPLNNSTSYFEGPSLSIDRINEILQAGKRAGAKEYFRCPYV